MYPEPCFHGTSSSISVVRSVFLGGYGGCSAVVVVVVVVSAIAIATAGSRSSIQPSLVPPGIHRAQPEIGIVDKVPGCFRGLGGGW